MIPIPTAWYIIAALALSNLFTGYMWERAGHKLDVIELSSELAAEEAKAAIKEQKQITEDTTNAWKSALDVTRADWAKRLRLANVQPMPGVSGPPGGVDGLPPDSLALAAQCTETTLAYENLQRWVQKQRRVK